MCIWRPTFSEYIPLFSVMLSYSKKGLSSVIKPLASNRFKYRIFFPQPVLMNHASSFPKGLQNALQPVLISCLLKCMSIFE